MAWQRGQDHDGLLDDFKLVERSSRKRQIAELRNSHNSDIGYIHDAPTTNDCEKCKPIIDIDLHR